jgi:heme/copper-type cytochrome/quinol oxidase subunit 2
VNGRGPSVLTAIFVTILAALVGGFVVLRTYTPPTSASPPITPEVRQFSLQMHAFKDEGAKMHHWIPSTLVVNTGDTVILKVTNGDPEDAHGFTVGAFNIAAPAINPGETMTFRFRATRSGVYQFQCNLAGCAPDHADQAGQLVVLGP